MGFVARRIREMDVGHDQFHQEHEHARLVHVPGYRISHEVVDRQVSLAC